ncbi:phage protease [Citrobacter freundii]
MNIIALCTELAGGGNAPEWVELLPAGPEIRGVDGRVWTLKNPHSLVKAFSARGIALVIDYEHATEVSAPKGQEAPAAGLIDEVTVRDDGSIWGKVEWTERASKAIAAREYRYLSPAFRYSPDGEITRFSSIALTNKPNLELTALNTQQVWQDIALALNVESLNSADDLLSALNRMQSGEHDKIVSEYISLGIFCPAQKDSLLAMCSRAGVDEFRKFADIQSAGKNYRHIVERSPARTIVSKGTLTDSQIATCRATGVSEKDFLIALGKENEQHQY